MSPHTYSPLSCACFMTAGISSAKERRFFEADSFPSRWRSLLNALRWEGERLLGTLIAQTRAFVWGPVSACGVMGPPIRFLVYFLYRDPTGGFAFRVFGSWFVDTRARSSLLFPRSDLTFPFICGGAKCGFISSCAPSVSGSKNPPPCFFPPRSGFYAGTGSRISTIFAEKTWRKSYFLLLRKCVQSG